MSKNTLDRSDISTYPIKLKYSASYASSSAYSYGITLNRGINGSFNSNGEDFLVYKLAKQLYYNLYLTGSLNNSASYWNDNLQSTAASGTFDNDYRYFPNAADDQITLMAIPRNVFGENISRKSLRISGTTYNLIDDGNGNIIDINNSNVHVGNVLYAQGIVTITNLDYEYALIDTPIPTTSTTTTTTTAAPTTTTTSTTTSTTTAEPTTTTTTSTTSTTTTAEPTTTTTTSTTSTTTTAEPTTSTTTTTTTAAPTTTTTSTTTTTTTASPVYTYDVAILSDVDPGQACLSPYAQVLYAAESTSATVTRFYTSFPLTVGNRYVGDGNYYRFEKQGSSDNLRGTIAFNGAVSNIGSC